ncbi:MAG: SIS domain-containing protein [Gemmatimonadetes bacterium]|nr:SIS domain-containing protein [Gemmatimonadota bacterium]
MSELHRALYPFLRDGGEGAEDRDGIAAALLADVRASTLRKAEDVTALRSALLARSGPALLEAARLTATALGRGGTLLAFGNGGSATDARDLVEDLTRPPCPGWRALPALSLVDDRGVLTAVANDVGFDEVFARQVIAYGRRGDVAVAFSTSGRSRSVLRGLEEARRRGLATIAFTGYDGGALSEPGRVDALVVAPSAHLPRIQEAHATAYHALVDLVQSLLKEAP